MDYLTIKSLHLIFVITWFAGLFYIVRLFIYQRETMDKPDVESSVLLSQFAVMAKRLWLGITWPSALLTVFFGTWLLVIQPSWLEQAFMHVKLGFVAFLIIYHLVCNRLYKKLQNGEPIWNSNKLRIWNELATIILVAVVFLIVKKNTVDWLYGTLGLVIFAGVLMLAIKWYKKLRNEK